MYFLYLVFTGAEKKKKKFKKKLDNTKKISTFAIPNTGSLNDGVVQGIKKKIEALKIEIESGRNRPELERSDSEAI